MLRTYLKIALRNVRRRTGFFFINVAGLAMGMVCCLLIVLYLRDELSYDRFHEHAERIARLTRTTSVMSAAPMAPALARDVPGVKTATRIVDYSGVVVQRGDGQVFKEVIYAADSTFCDIFSFKILQGDPQAALGRPDGLILTETAARKYFGGADPLGQGLTIHMDEPVDFTVTGVIGDVPRQAHFHFDFLVSFKLVEAQSSRIENWQTNWLYTYLLLDEGAKPNDVEARLPAFFERHAGERWDHFRVQPLLDVRLHSAHLAYDIAPQGSMAYVLLFAAIAALILLIACINFMNLATALSLKRAKEVGVRKVLGARRAHLVAQHLGESLLLAVLALLLAGVVVLYLLPHFGHVTGTQLVLTWADSGFLLLCFVALAAGVGVTAGSYPAFFLSGFQPIETLKGAGASRAAGSLLRKGLVAFQFAASIFLIVGTLVVHQQLDYLQNARLGFDKEQIVVLPFGDVLQDRYELVKQEILQHPGVLAITATGDVPGQGVSDFLYRPEGVPEDDLPGWDTYFVDPDFASVLGLEVVQGRSFTPLASDSNAFLINESALEAIVAQRGNAGADPIGQPLEFYLPGAEGWEVARRGPIVGVVKDFNYQSMHAEIGPLVMHVAPQAFDHVLVKVGAEDLDGTLAFLEEQWGALGPAAPFEYDFLDAAFNRLYRAEERVGTFFGIFAALGIVIACLGLFGLAALMAEQRTKEIGVRKVFGASVPGLVGLLSADFLKLVGVAFIVAAPMAYLGTQRWLMDFAYRIEPGLGVFVLAGLIAVVVALATVSMQALRAARLDPVKTLRYE